MDKDVINFIIVFGVVMLLALWIGSGTGLNPTPDNCELEYTGIGGTSETVCY